jgi:hypothetical protein
MSSKNPFVTTRTVTEIHTGSIQLPNYAEIQVSYHKGDGTVGLRMAYPCAFSAGSLEQLADNLMCLAAALRENTNQ